MAETATGPKTIPPAVFQKWAGGNKLIKKLNLKQIEQDKTIKKARFVNLNNEESS